jgi:hypothetical protein
VDIVDADKVPNDYYRIVRANKRDLARADSEGDYFLTLYHLWPLWLQEEAKDVNKDDYPNIDQRFGVFCSENTAQAPTNIKRYRTLLSSEVWRELAYKYCQFAVGRASFRAHHFVNASSYRMNKVGILSRT